MATVGEKFLAYKGGYADGVNEVSENQSTVGFATESYLKGLCDGWRDARLAIAGGKFRELTAALDGSKYKNPPASY